MDVKNKLYLNLCTQELLMDSKGYKNWYKCVEQINLDAAETAILICDMWDRHWCRGAEERGEMLAVKINELNKKAREKGISIIHAPSGTMDFYAVTKARKRMLDIPQIDPPKPLNHPDYPLPVDDSDNGSDTGETTAEIKYIWSRQNAVIEIDDNLDVITDDGREAYRFLRHKGIKNLLYVGVHTNMCILNRSFGIKQMVRWGINTVLVRDLTDSLYNPAMPPYVSHDEGTGLVVEYIEKFWCPTILSHDIQ